MLNRYAFIPRYTHLGGVGGAVLEAFISLEDTGEGCNKNSSYNKRKRKGLGQVLRVNKTSAKTKIEGQEAEPLGCFFGHSQQSFANLRNDRDPSSYASPCVKTRKRVKCGQELGSHLNATFPHGYAQERRDVVKHPRGKVLVLST